MKRCAEMERRYQHFLNGGKIYTAEEANRRKRRVSKKKEENKQY